MPLHAVVRNDDWHERLARLCALRAEQVVYRKTLDEGIDSLSAEIRAVMEAHHVDAIEVPGFRVLLVTASRSKLSAERLLELGVPTDVIAEAVTVTPQVSLRITELEDGHVA